MSGLDRRLLGAGAALVLLINAVVLAGVAYNRSGEPDALITLSERELERPRAWGDSRDNNGIALDLHWRVASGDDEHGDAMYNRSPDWLDAAALRALGFPEPAVGDGDYSHRRLQLERAVWVVLELGGEAYARALARAERRLAERQARVDASPGDREFVGQRDAAARELAEERDTRSRLFAIDAGLDAAGLRARYPDRGRFVVVGGRVRPQYPTHDATARTGYLSGIDIDQIHVPVDFRAVFEPVGAAPTTDPPRARHQVTLAYGRRHEPWIVAAEPR